MRTHPHDESPLKLMRPEPQQRKRYNGGSEQKRRAQAVGQTVCEAAAAACALCAQEQLVVDTTAGWIIGVHPSADNRCSSVRG